MSSFSYVEHQQVETIRNDINLKKETLRFEPDEENPGKFLLSFTFDATVSGSITVMFFAREEEECTLKATKEDLFPSMTVSFPKGMSQKFKQPCGTGIDFSALSETELVEASQSVYYYHVAVKAEASSEDNPGSKTPNCQITHAVLKRDKGEYKARVVKQILWVNGIRYVLQDIYGIGDTNDDSGEDGNETGKECVICLTEPRDATVFPCRHMCMCSGCAKLLRFQTNLCPICRQPISYVFSTLLDERKVDVFLSFSNNNIGRELFKHHLFLNGIKTFESNSWKETRVRPIDQRTLEALEESKVAVVMMSHRGPFSVGFLEELIAILEFQERGSLTVIPIFLTPYPLDDVEEEICQQYPVYAPSWRIALTKLANIAADCPLSRSLAGMGQSDLLKQIAHIIDLLCLSSTSNDLNALVAMDRHMKVVHDLLASEVNKEVRTIGIWGSPGVGKTTLARYIYAEISVNFQTHVFLENAENMKDKILKFEGEEGPTVIRSLDHDVHEITEARRKHRKVLLIADDVNSIEQGKWIIEYTNWFAPGSRVILISQNKNLLVDAGAMDLYEVRSLRYDEALQLFSHFAFKQSYPPSDFEQLAVRAVHLAGFIPLALRLLGSFLTDRGLEEWIAALLKLKPKHGENILEVWKLTEASQDIGQEKREAAADIMEGKESSQDQGQEEREAAADIMERKKSSQDEGQEKREVAADIMEGKESSQDEGKEKRDVALRKRNEKQGQDLVEALEDKDIT